MTYRPVTIEFGDWSPPPTWSRHAQALPLLVNKGAVLQRLLLTIRGDVNEAGAAELVVHLEWSEPPSTEAVGEPMG